MSWRICSHGTQPTSLMNPTLIPKKPPDSQPSSATPSLRLFFQVSWPQLRWTINCCNALSNLLLPAGHLNASLMTLTRSSERAKSSQPVQNLPKRVSIGDLAVCVRQKQLSRSHTLTTSVALVHHNCEPAIGFAFVFKSAT